MTKYEMIFESLQRQLDQGLISEELADKVNDLAYEKYLSEATAYAKRGYNAGLFGYQKSKAGNEDLATGKNKNRMRIPTLSSNSINRKANNHPSGVYAKKSTDSNNEKKAKIKQNISDTKLRNDVKKTNREIEKLIHPERDPDNLLSLTKDERLAAFRKKFNM